MVKKDFVDSGNTFRTAVSVDKWQRLPGVYYWENLMLGSVTQSVHEGESPTWSYFLSTNHKRNQELSDNVLPEVIPHFWNGLAMITAWLEVGETQKHALGNNQCPPAVSHFLDGLQHRTWTFSMCCADLARFLPLDNGLWDCCPALEPV